VTRILVTGGQGFLGRNLVAHLLERKDCQATILSRDDSAADFRNKLRAIDIVFHLAGVNRPQDPIDFQRGNVELTEQLCQLLREARRCPKIVFSSSMQTTLDNPYGASKARAEGVLREFASETGACVRIYRLKNLFGKWGRPNYNSVTATFCHNIANDLPIDISDPARELDLSYVDDVVTSFLAEIDGRNGADLAGAEIRSYRVKLGDLAGRVQGFREMRATLTLPDFAEWFNRALYATYLSYVPEEERRYSLEVRSDVRGSLAEFVKQPHFGQVFVSRTEPGATRGNHYHHTKVEKFFVVEGKALIRMRPVEGGPVAEYSVTGNAYQVIDIPPGFTHSIANVGTEDLVTLFWSSEIFDPNRPDTYYLDVDFEERSKALSVEHA
jgi:UDP-2-acetamido-2,6-beta-L-arabino-hexul-4-ose reductase